MFYSSLPTLSWSKKTLYNIFLYSNLNSPSPLAKGAQGKTKPRLKKNLFNMKWKTKKYLTVYYNPINTMSSSHLSTKGNNPVSYQQGEVKNQSKRSYIESRLDIVLFRTNWFMSISSVHKLIAAQGVLLNGKPVNPGEKGLQLKPNDLITLLPKKGILNSHVEGEKLASPLWNHSKKSTSSLKPRINPNWVTWFKLFPSLIMKQTVRYLEINPNNFSVVYLYHPTFKDIPYPFPFFTSPFKTRRRSF